MQIKPILRLQVWTEEEMVNSVFCLSSPPPKQRRHDMPKASGLVNQVLVSRVSCAVDKATICGWSPTSPWERGYGLSATCCHSQCSFSWGNSKARTPNQLLLSAAWGGKFGIDIRSHSGTPALKAENRPPRDPLNRKALQYELNDNEQFFGSLSLFPGVGAREGNVVIFPIVFGLSISQGASLTLSSKSGVPNPWPKQECTSTTPERSKNFSHSRSTPGVSS